MPAKVIGNTLPIGFAGTISSMSDCVIKPFLYSPDAETPIQFGMAVGLNNDGTVGILSGSNKFIGFAVRHVGQPYANNENGWYYAPGEAVDVMIRGTMVVPVEDEPSGMSAESVFAAGADVKIASSGFVGATGINATNTIFSTGMVEDGLVEIVLTKRVV